LITSTQKPVTARLRLAQTNGGTIGSCRTAQRRIRLRRAAREDRDNQPCQEDNYVPAHHTRPIVLPPPGLRAAVLAYIPVI